MVEGFGYPNTKFGELRRDSTSMFMDIMTVVNRIIPDPDQTKVAYLSTWPPAKKKGKLYTFDTIMDWYGLTHLHPKMGWRDAIDVSAKKWRDGMKREEVYSKDYSLEQMDAADERICKFIRDGGHSKSSSYRSSVLILDTQSWLYGGFMIEVQLMLERFKYSKVHDLKGGEIIVWVKNDPPTVVLLVGHPSLAGDARANIGIRERQRRGVGSTTIKNVIGYLSGEMKELEDFDDQGVFGVTVSEHLARDLHTSVINIALLYRDAILSRANPSASALSTFEGPIRRENSFTELSNHDIRELKR